MPIIRDCAFLIIIIITKEGHSWQTFLIVKEGTFLITKVDAFPIIKKGTFPTTVGGTFLITKEEE